MVRLKYRYVIGQILTENSYEDSIIISPNELISAMREKIQLLFGDVGYGRFGNFTSIKFFDKYSLLFVIRAGREFLCDLWLSLSCITVIQKISICIRALKIASCARTCVMHLRTIVNKTLIENSDKTDIAERKTYYENELEKFEG